VFTAVEVVRSDQHSIVGNDYYTSFVECCGKVFADLIKLTHEVLDLLLTEHELFAMTDAVAESQLNSGLADTALGDARSVVMGFCHRNDGDSHSIDPLVGHCQAICCSQIGACGIKANRAPLRTQLYQSICTYQLTD
jgi:hypothetical protein